MKNVLIALLVVVALFAGFVATRPGTYHVERSATLAASPEVIRPMIADFHRWPDWSPWEKLDPAMKKDFGGPESGPGATYHWVGNDKVGEGRMTITDATTPTDVAIKLEFIKPFASTCDTRFALAPDAAGTKVTWSMDGKANFMTKAMGVFSPMDKMVGPDFEHGLAAMKSMAESAAPAVPDSSAKPAS